MGGLEPVNILLVDDTPAKLLSYEAILQELGERLIKASSAKAALVELLKNDVAVILTDVCMPDLDGFEFAEMLREHPRCARTAVIFISAVHMTHLDYVRGYNSGAVDYVTVPIIPEILRAKVKIFAELYRKTKQLEHVNDELEQRVAVRTRELEASGERLGESEQRLRLASQAAGFGTYDYDVNADRIHWSSPLKTFSDAGVPEPSSLAEFLDIVHVDDRAAVRSSMLSGADAAVGRREIEFRALARNGETRWVLDRGQAFGGVGGKSARVRGTMLDITNRKSSEAHQDLLMAELDHRVKNTLANVLAIASLSSKQAASVPAFVRALQGRIQSMSTAHDLLRRANWEGADFHKLATETLRPFQTAEGNIRFVSSGVKLHPKAAQSIALVLHELATNALKHGSLSKAEGRVDMTCERIGAGRPGRLKLVWRETGGPPAKHPDREGFGLTALRAAASEAGAAVSIDFEMSGLVYTLEGPLLVPEDGVDESSGKVGEADLRMLASGARQCAKPGPCRILIVEDEPLIALELRFLLEEEGHEVVGPAMNLEHGLRLAQQDRFDIAFLDINLGRETSGPIALHLSERRIPFVFSTGHTDVSAVPEGFRDIRRLQKPYAIEDIRRILEGVSARPLSAGII